MSDEAPQIISGKHVQTRRIYCWAIPDSAIVQLYYIQLQE